MLIPEDSRPLHISQGVKKTRSFSFLGAINAIKRSLVGNFNSNGVQFYIIWGPFSDHFIEFLAPKKLNNVFLDTLYIYLRARGSVDYFCNIKVDAFEEKAE